MRLFSPLLTGLMFTIVSQAYCISIDSEKNKHTDEIVIPATQENNQVISPNLPGNLPSEIPSSTTSQAVSPEKENLSALIQLMNSKAFQGLSICTVDPWKGLEYAKNLELEYLRNLLPLNIDTSTLEQLNFRKEISELIITSGRELQEIRERCLDTEKIPEKLEAKTKKDKDEDGIP